MFFLYILPSVLLPEGPEILEIVEISKLYTQYDFLIKVY